MQKNLFTNHGRKSDDRIGRGGGTEGNRAVRGLGKVFGGEVPKKTAYRGRGGVCLHIEHLISGFSYASLI